ncbi:glycosyltransferase family 2 protein, partial [bacterium]|nr:glycosyltransferase family 2 protein [bacterium]
LEGKPDTWDYQWFFTCLANGGLTALPNRNLVSNVGFGEDATHTTGEQIPTEIDHGGVLPILCPTFMVRDLKADEYTFDHIFGGISMRHSRRPMQRVRRKASSLLRKLFAVFKVFLYVQFMLP